MKHANMLLQEAYKAEAKKERDEREAEFHVGDAPSLFGPLMLIIASGFAVLSAAAIAGVFP